MRDEPSMFGHHLARTRYFAARWLAPWLACSVLFSAGQVRADETPTVAAPPASAPSDATAAPLPGASPVVGAAAAPDAPAVPKPKPPPYVLPWQLRPAAAASVIRSDTAFAFRKPADKGGTTVASMLLGSYKVTPEFAAMVRLGMVSDSPPVGDSGTALINPVLGGTYVFKLSKEFRLAAFLGITVPVGGGGGNTPDKATRAAVLAGIPARSAMDNAMFAVNYFTVFPGLDLAYVAGGLTIQAEATLLQLIRTRGDNVDKDSTRTNFTAGLFVGYFLIPELSLGAELRYQAWLSNKSVNTGTAGRDNVTFAVGPRFHFKVSDTMWFRPGIAYARGIDKPMTDNNYNIVQLDLPLSF
jgi:hypothetical protein